MSGAVSLDLTPTQAAELIQSELTQARKALHTGRLDGALDGYARGLGLALQLGPAPTEQVLVAVLQAAHRLVQLQDARGLSTLGPVLASLIARVRGAGVLPPTAVMEAWATVATDLGTLIGQVGLALDLPPGHRKSMLDNARHRAVALDEATGTLFRLTAWIEKISAAERAGTAKGKP